jgi:hypothetical protein
MKLKWLMGCLVGLLISTGSAMAVPEVLATDDAGNYTLTTFTNQSNAGTGFGAWDLWGELATLGDSTAGGGGDLNSTNGYSFRFMGDGAGGWCNGKRNLSGDLQTDDVLSFTFTYNWDGGGRGVDIFCSTGQFANVIDVSSGNSFKVNGAEISTNWSPGAVVSVDITQLTNGIQVHLVRETNDVENLNYTTNILNPEAASGVSLYCGGYSAGSPGDNVNYAIFMNELRVEGEPRTSLNFTDGTWDPSVIGDYAYTLVREGAVDDDIVLSSTDTNVLTVPASAMFVTGSNTLVITAAVVSVSSGPATIIASNVTSGMWAEYNVTPEGPTLTFTDGTWNPDTIGDYAFTLERNATVGDDIVLSSTDTNVLTVPATAIFDTGTNVLVFSASVVSVSSGPATIIASNVASGAWAEYNVTPVPPTLTFIDGTWDPDTAGDYTYTLERNATVGDDIVLSSTDTNILTVPVGAMYDTGTNVLVFTASVLSVSSGSATIIASNVASGAWTTYNVTPVAPTLSFSAGTYDPTATGDYTYTLERSGVVGDDIVLSSTDTNVLTVPAAMTYGAGTNSLIFTAAVVSVSSGPATLIASNVASGAWAEYVVTPIVTGPVIGDLVFDTITGDMSFTVPAGYSLFNVEGADNELLAGEWQWFILSLNVDYVVAGDQVTIVTSLSPRKVIRIWLTENP